MIRVLTNYMSINVSNTDRYVLFYSVNIYRYITLLSLILGILLCSPLVSSYPSVLAQSSNAGVGASAPNQYQGGQGMILEKISDKGNYRVQIMWNQLGSQSANAVPSGNTTSSPTIPKQGFEMEVDFLNASAPLPTGKTVPQKESSIKSESPVGASVNQIPTPSIIQTTVPVDSYDITIYSDHGQELWKKLNQPVTAGRGVQRVVFENSNYTGGITIQITNIKSGDIPPNAVTFTAKVA
jgi:hypothetical protein